MDQDAKYGFFAGSCNDTCPDRHHCILRHVLFLGLLLKSEDPCRPVRHPEVLRNKETNWAVHFF